MYLHGRFCRIYLRGRMVIYNTRMQVKNQFVVISGILALLATATIAASGVVQPAKADCASNTGPYGRGCISGNANPNICAEGTNQCGSGFGATASGLARDDSGNGVGTGDFGRAPGCGNNRFPVESNGAPSHC
jgi:hypothetical protein